MIDNKGWRGLYSLGSDGQAWTSGKQGRVVMIKKSARNLIQRHSFPDTGIRGRR